MTAFDPARTLAISRLLPGPPELCFRAWTEHFQTWWGPHGMTTPVCVMELRPGGVFRTVMRAPDGADYPTAGVFLEVVPGARIVFTDAYGPDWQPNPGLFFTCVTTFTARPEGGTLYEATALHWTAEAAQEHARMGFHLGWSECADRLAAVVASLVRVGVA